MDVPTLSRTSSTVAVRGPVAARWGRRGVGQALTLAATSCTRSLLTISGEASRCPKAPQLGMISFQACQPTLVQGRLNLPTVHSEG